MWKLTGLPLPEPDGSARREAGDFRDRNMTWPARPSTIDLFEFQQRNDLVEYLNRSATERGFPLNEEYVGGVILRHPAVNTYSTAFLEKGIGGPDG